MVQTIIVVLLVLLDVAAVQLNPAAFQRAMTLTMPGSGGPLSVTAETLMVAAGAALVLAWIAGLIDRAGLDRHVSRCETTMRAMSDEMLRLKARTYDEERRPLEDIRTRLDTLDRDIRGLRARLDREPLPKPEDTARVTLKESPTMTIPPAGRAS